MSEVLNLKRKRKVSEIENEEDEEKVVETEEDEEEIEIKNRKNQKNMNKKQKVSNTKSKAKVSNDEEDFYDIGRNKRITVAYFKNNIVINFRCYYNDKPTKKGLTMNLKEWEKFKNEGVNYIDDKIEDL
eukprot:TRINITY_DN1583_c0_g1_i1.p1 TRINITY_DN1583_c0_g1~~TRINITY_DN1583_c0_g1_i1.p1  ORF type:complete len:129 (+),score=49.20 TRINITY_DN1583_c0_g1_i1:68-454(+)